jgi:glycosyltransferase involved in cell wall biosynthesis
MFATWHEALDASEWVSYMGKLGMIAKAIENLAVLTPSSIGTASEHTLSRLRVGKQRTNRVQFVGTGVDFESIGRSKPIGERLDVIYVGRLVKSKNVSILIDAMADVVAQNADAKCYIFGSGVEQESLAIQIATYGLEDSVFLKGSLPQSDQIYAYMKTARVLVLPSNREGFGIVAAEALACGTPVITIDAINNAAAALVTPGINGSVVDLNREKIAQAVLHWISAPRKIQTSGVFEKFSWDSVVQRQLELYQS